jgi:putative transposase
VRKVRDEELKLEISRAWNENRRVYGADKVWAQLNRQGVWVARCTVERSLAQGSHQGSPPGQFPASRRDSIGRYGR